MNEEEMRILKTGSCPSLSGQSVLTYTISRKGKEVYFSLVENSLRGLFSKEAVALKEMVPTKGQSITSGSLNKLFGKKSINSGGFMLAVLRHEGLVTSVEGKRGSYITTDPSGFISSITPKKGKQVEVAT